MAGHKLYWNTVNPMLRYALSQLMSCPLFDTFRLVGGTALSLQLGHRESIDIDLFTDAAYDSVDFQAIDNYLRSIYPYVTNSVLSGPGGFYYLGENKDNCIKLDLYYTDPFIYPALQSENIRIATVDEIIAMKVDIVQRGGRKKDFWDLHEIMDSYIPGQMLELHKQRYPYDHNEELIMRNFTNFSTADDDFEPVCLKGKYWELIKLDFIKWLQH